MRSVFLKCKESGLQEVANPSEYLLDGRPENASGCVVACSMEGTRPILVEIQALVCQKQFRHSQKDCSRERILTG